MRDPFIADDRIARGAGVGATCTLTTTGPVASVAMDVGVGQVTQSEVTLCDRLLKAFPPWHCPGPSSARLTIDRHHFLVVALSYFKVAI